LSHGKKKEKKKRRNESRKERWGASGLSLIQGFTSENVKKKKTIEPFLLFKEMGLKRRN